MTCNDRIRTNSYHLIHFATDFTCKTRVFWAEAMWMQNMWNSSKQKRQRSYSSLQNAYMMRTVDSILCSIILRCSHCERLYIRSEQSRIGCEIKQIATDLPFIDFYFCGWLSINPYVHFWLLSTCLFACIWSLIYLIGTMTYWLIRAIHLATPNIGNCSFAEMESNSTQCKYNTYL